jgi:hypothetical protein
MAGLRLRVELPRGPIHEALLGPLSGFGAPAAAGDADLTLEIELLPGAAARPFGQRPLPRIDRGADGLRIDGEEFTATLEPQARRGVVRQKADRFALETVLKVCLAELLRVRGGLLVHGVAVALGGRAACFVGNSGAGKSTLGALAREGGLALLADELVALVPDPSGWMAFGTPWNTGEQAQGRLVAVGRLAFGESSQFRRGGEAEVLRAILPNSLLPGDLAGLRQEVFQAASRLLREVPAGTFAFAPDPGAAQALRALLEGAP